MSYQKVLAVPLNYISFTYTHANIIARIKEETQYKARMFPEKFDELAFSDDEADVLDRYIKDAIYHVGTKMYNLTDGLALAGTGAINVSATDVNIFVIDHSVYNDNILTLIDRETELAIQAYILLKWWEKCGMLDDVKIQEIMLMRSMSDLNEHIWELRIPDIDAVPSSVQTGTDIFTETIDPITLLAATETRVDFTQDYQSTNYVVSAYDSTGKSIPGFDATITDRDSDGFSYTIAVGYVDATLVIVGSTDVVLSSSTKTEVVIVTSVEVDVEKVVTHSFGSAYYFAQAIQSDGLNVPGFDDMITTRGSDQFRFTSLIAYASLTIILIGASS